MAIEGTAPAVAAPARSEASLPAVVREWVREQLTTTPGRLALLAVLVVVGAVALGAVAEIAEQARQSATSSARTATEPLLAETVTLYGSLSDANATATTTFLVGGLEPPARRARYLRDVRVASDSLAQLTGQVGVTGTARGAVATVARELPIYTGLVEAARANNRQRLPIGAAYMRQGSMLMTGTILPAAGRLYTIEAGRLRDDYSSGTSTPWLIAFVAAIGAMLALLVWMQWYLARISHRILNVPTAIATVLVAAIGVWGVVGMIGEQNALAKAQRNGSDQVEVLSAARILASRAQSDESLTLIARGGDTTDPVDFAAVTKALGQPGSGKGLDGEIAALARRTGTEGAASEFDSALRAYLAQHAQIATLAGEGQTSSANLLATGPAGGSGVSPADRVAADLSAQITAAQTRFEQSAADASSSLDGLAFAIPVAVVLAALLSLYGLRQRQMEYR
jgi:hypothetical protein